MYLDLDAARAAQMKAYQSLHALERRATAERNAKAIRDGGPGRRAMHSYCRGQLARVQITRGNGTPAEVLMSDSGQLVKFETGKPANRTERRGIARQIKRFMKKQRSGNATLAKFSGRESEI